MAQPETRLSLRPFMKLAPGGFTVHLMQTCPKNVLVLIILYVHTKWIKLI